MSESNLFSDKVCHYCNENPNYDDRDEHSHLWNGFKDGDMNIYVCWKCRKTHYQEKMKTEHAGKYTEFPVYAVGGII